MKQISMLTQGDVTSTLCAFSLPFLLTNILQALYGASDLFMVGRFSDAASVSAVAIGSQMMQTVTGLVIGLTTGGTILIGQLYGAGNRKAVADTIATLCALFGLLAIGLTLFFIAMQRPLCHLMKVPAEAFGDTRSYLQICAFGIVFIVGYNVISCILRGLGDSRTPLLFMVIACGTNITTDYIFVGVLHMGARGAAMSTVLAQGLSLVLSVLYLFLRGTVSRWFRHRPEIRLGIFLRAMAVGGPISMQEGLTNLSFLVITSLTNRMGFLASATVGIVEKLILFSMLPTTALAAAVAAMTAQNQGAGRQDRALQCLRVGIGLSLLFGMGAFLCAQINPAGLIHIFTEDPTVMEMGARYYRVYSADCVLVCFVFSLNSFLSGSGHVVFPLVHGVIATCLVRIPLAWLFSVYKGGSLFAVGFAAPGATLISLILCIVYFTQVVQKRSRGALYPRRA